MFSLKEKVQKWKKAHEPSIKELKFILYRIRKSPLSLLGTFIIVFYIIIAVCAPILAPPNPDWDILKIRNPFIIPDSSNEIDPKPPSPTHPFGITVEGYDIYYGCVWGTITAFRVGVMVIAFALIIGILVGITSGYYGGLVDEILMRFTDIIICFPGLILAMALVVALPPTLTVQALAIVLPVTVVVALITLAKILRGIREITQIILLTITIALIIVSTSMWFNIIPNINVLSIPLTRLDKVLIALVLVGWPGYARVIRGEVLRARSEDYVEAAKAIGASDLRIITRHIIPNTIYPILILASLDIGSVVLTAAALSFLGIGAEPNYADWGQLVQKCEPYMLGADIVRYWYIWLIPGAFIFTFGLGWNLLGDAVRDILDPTLRRR